MKRWYKIRIERGERGNRRMHQDVQFADVYTTEEGAIGAAFAQCPDPWIGQTFERATNVLVTHM